MSPSGSESTEIPGLCCRVLGLGQRRYNRRWIEGRRTAVVQDQAFKSRQSAAEVILWAELAKVPPAKQVEYQRRRCAGI
jgi:hypothetical protein